MMRVLEGVNAKTDMAEDVDQVVGLGGRTLINMRYALGLRLRKDKNGQRYVWISSSNGRKKTDCGCKNSWKFNEIIFVEPHT